MGASLEKLWGKDGFVKKTQKYVRVLGPKERGKIGNINSMVDVMHRALLLWEQGEKEKLISFLSKTGYGRSGMFWQFCQAVAESLLPGNKEKQMLEGLLVGKDSYIKSAAKVRGQRGLEDFVTEGD